MKLMLDTHTMLWWLADTNLKSGVNTLISSPENHVVISAATLWESMIKVSKGKLAIDADLEETLHKGRVEILPVDARSALAVRDLPHHHGDPFDRMIIAQALLDGYTVITRDKMFKKYGVDVIAA